MLMFNKSLVQVSVDWLGCVSSLLFDLRPNYGGGNEDNSDLLQKILCMHCCTLPLTQQQATTDPCLCWRLPDTHGQVWVSLLWGHCSFLLGAGAHKFLFVTSKCLFPQFFISSGGSVLGLMENSFKWVYATPMSAAPIALVPVAVHCWSVPPQETLKHSKAGLAESLSLSLSDSFLMAALPNSETMPWAELICTRDSFSQHCHNNIKLKIW